jgi:CRISPR-associated protein Cas1
MSFLHAPNENEPTLVFDLIEEFRCQAVDRAVITMVIRGERLAQEKPGGLLNEETRRKVAENVLERLASLVPYRKRKIQLDEVIRLQPRRLARCLEKEKVYRPFVGRY